MIQKLPDLNRDGWSVVFDEDGALAWTAAVGGVPAHSPYQPGDWVTIHGYAALARLGHRDGAWGMRGFVLGCYGSTILWGLTDDGRPWSEHWGHLDRDGTPDPDGMCVCHPHSQRRRPARRAAEQLDLFDLQTVLR